MSSSSSLPKVRLGLKRKANEMEDESQKSPRCIDVDPQGQVLFKVGEGDAACTIRVSGPLICQASPTFARLISSAPIKGGDKVETRPVGKPEVYLDFFNMIHYKHAKIGTLTGRRLLELAKVADDMGRCVESFRPFIAYRLFPIIHEITTASNDTTGTKTVVKALEEYRVTFEVLLSIALYCEMNELFWRTTKVAVAQAPKQLGPLPVDYHFWHEKLCDQINKARKNAVTDFLVDVFECIDKSHPLAPEVEDPGEGVTSYGTFHELLRTQGIIAHKISNYNGTLVQAVEVVRRVADLAKAKVNPKVTSPGGGNGTILNTQAGCRGYMAGDIKGDLLKVIDTHTKLLRGVSLVSLNDSRYKNEDKWDLWKEEIYGDELDMSGL